ncbi:MAG: 16S rRNA (cytosine(967)-C(5))-methyltransferase RsmB [Cellulosilyticaceae bacterium]
MKSTREHIADILTNIEKEQSYMQLVLKAELENFEVKDRAFINEIIYGTIKYRITIDYIINQFSKTPINKMKPFIRSVMRMSVYQIMYLDKVPASAAINEAVKIVHRRKMSNLSGFINGVLRNIDRNKESIVYPDDSKNPISHLSVIYSVPEWLLEMWTQDYGIEVTKRICESLNERAKVCIRINSLVATKEEVLAELKELGIDSETGELLPGESMYITGATSIAQMDSFKQGKWAVQDESATLVGHVVDPKAGEIVLDMCSAPGGKSTHMAMLMQNKGMIMSADVHEHKMDIIQKNAKRLGVEIIEPVLQDGTKINEAWKEKFDKVLLDAPCSGLGIIKRKPDIRYSKTLEDVKAIAQLQEKLLENAVCYLKQDGILVYSTCTISKQENEGIIKCAVEKLGLELDSIEEYMPNILKPYIENKATIQIMPFMANTDGFFIARFRKRGN